MRAKVLWTMLMAFMLLALVTSPAFAEGYNRNSNGLITPQKGWGGQSADGRLRYTGQYQLLGTAEVPQAQPQGPHGGYATTTNKCQDCHSTHYAYGSYMLLRANSREAACDFCHGGGGGSTRAIMMDNPYTTTAADVLGGASVASSCSTMGPGTGHTLGYKGRAPADIDPAFQSSDGFACFDCHTPHGNSARALATFFAPGRKIGLGNLSSVTYVRWPLALDPSAIDPDQTLERTVNGQIEGLPLEPAGVPIEGRGEHDGWLLVWGVDTDTGNIVMKYDLSPLGIGEPGVVVVSKTMVFPTGRFLLLKNPDNENGGGAQGDMDVTTTTAGGITLVAEGANKIKIDWGSPLGPATHLNSGANVYYTGNDERFPYPMYFTGLGEDRPGIATEAEYCTDCHDGAAGFSSQAAVVWHPNSPQTGPLDGEYVTAYSHDVQPRGCDRKLYLNPEDDANFGPDCRSCHSGAGSCEACHANPSSGMTGSNYAIDPETQTPLKDGYTTYDADPYFKMIRQKWVYTQPGATYRPPNAACVDGGFSYPHRTLGVNMLKDTLWGVDFDGTPIRPGEKRAAGGTLQTVAEFYGDAKDDLVDFELTSFQLEALIDAPAGNLDSACIDCHNPTIWNGDDPSYEASFTAVNYFYDLGYRLPQVPEWRIRGWDLLLKGLP